MPSTWPQPSTGVVDEFHTYDGGLSKYEELLSFKICEPSVAEQQLPGM